MPLVRALYHSIRLSERIPMMVSPTLADTCLVSYHSFQSTKSYSHATASSPILFGSSQRADSIELLPNSIRPLAGHLTSQVNQASPALFHFSFFHTSLYIPCLCSLKYMCLTAVSIAYNSLFLYASALLALTCIPVCLRTLKPYCVPAICSQSSEDYQIFFQKKPHLSVRCRYRGVLWYY